MYACRSEIHEGMGIYRKRCVSCGCDGLRRCGLCCVKGGYCLLYTSGPSEILIVADYTANPKYAAADLMSQAEHDKLASSVLITTIQRVAYETVKEIERQVADLSRKDIINTSLDNCGAIIIRCV